MNRGPGHRPIGQAAFIIRNRSHPRHTIAIRNGSGFDWPSVRPWMKHCGSGSENVAVLTAVARQGEAVVRVAAPLRPVIASDVRSTKAAEALLGAAHRDVAGRWS